MIKNQVKDETKKKHTKTEWMRMMSKRREKKQRDQSTIKN